MLVATFGPPSAFTHWCLHALSIMSSVVLGEFDYVSVSTAQDFKTALANRQKPHMNFFTDCPDRGLVDAFTKTGLPFLTLIEDPEDVTGFIMRERSLNWKQAVRLTTLTLTTTSELFASPMALGLSRSAGLTIGEFLDRVVGHLGMELGQDQRSQIVRRLFPAGDASSSTEEALLALVAHAAPAGKGLDVSDAERMILAPLHAGMRRTNGDIMRNFRWPSELFIGAEGPDEPLRQPIEMLGPARCLIYGPYLHLPAGNWEVRLILDVDENFSGNWVDIDIFHGTILHLESFKLPASGRMAVITKFAIEESREPVQIRVIQREGAIEGLLRIEDVQVRRVDGAAFRPFS